MQVPFIDEIDALNAAGVDFVVVGGVAVILHGYGRQTLDLDFIVRFDRQNVYRMVSCLRGLGYSPKTPVDPEKLADAGERRSWKERNMVALAFFNHARPYIIVDVFIDHPIDYDELRTQSKEFTGTDGRRVRVCSLDHLIRLKEQAGRDKDLQDLKYLQFIREQQQETL